MKKIVLIFVFAIMGSAYAQQNSKICNFEYNVSSIETIDDAKKGIYQSEITWDFKKLNLKNIVCTIEIVPILDCFNGMEASNFKNTIFISSKDESFQPKDSKIIKHLEIMSKCYKWRTVIVDSKNSCQETSEWKYCSFLNK
jgi:hypothetical protein